MTPRARKDGSREPLHRTLDDIAQVLESAERSEERVRRALELVKRLVPYERCALLEEQPGREPRLVIVPEASPERAAFLGETLAKLFAQLVEERSLAAGALAGIPAGARGPHLAVPLVGLDRVIGVLFVHSAAEAFGLRHLRALSMVASKLAAYLTMCHARSEEAYRAGEIEKVRGAAEAAIRSKDRFLALVSTELKTPLAAALDGVCVLGSRGASEADRARALETIDGGLRAQGRLIDDLIDLSRIASAELRLDPRPIDPISCVKASIDALQPLAERKSIRIETVLDESLPPLVVDPRRLGQIVSNLLANAIQFTPGGGRVEVRLERAGAHVRLRVIDSGLGISAAELPHVFERFHRAGDPRARDKKGLGIGLAIVKSLVELHGGRVRAESEGAGRGSTFTVDLPRAVEASVPA